MPSKKNRTAAAEEHWLTSKEVTKEHKSELGCLVAKNMVTADNNQLKKMATDNVGCGCCRRVRDVNLDGGG